MTSNLGVFRRLSLLGILAFVPLVQGAVTDAVSYSLQLPAVKEPEIPNRSVTLTDFGAKGDGIADNTQAFAKAIEHLVAKGGGKLIVPSGLWKTGPIVFKSRIELHLERGAIIQFSANRSDFPLVETSFEGQKAWRCQSPLSGFNLEHIAITGAGIIDGSGEVWRPVKKDKLTAGQWKALVESGGVTDAASRIWYPSAAARMGNEERGGRDWKDPKQVEEIRDSLRPVMLSFVSSRFVKLEGVTFQNSPAWCLHPLMCEDVTIRGVTVRNPWYAQNGDGLDLESCRNAVIEDSSFDVGDDAICIKSGKDAEGRKRGRPTENVLVRNNVVYHGHGGFVVGSEMSGGVRNIQVENCVFVGTDVGLRFKSARGRGGVVERIRISGIRMTHIPEDAILFDLFYAGKKTAFEGVPPVTEETPSFRDIAMRDISISGARQAGLFQGLIEMPVKDILLESSTITAQNGIRINDAANITLRQVTLSISQGPSISVNNSQSIHAEKLVANAPLQVDGPRTKDIALSDSDPNLVIKQGAALAPGAVSRK